MPTFWDERNQCFREAPIGQHADLGDGIFATQGRCVDPMYPAGSYFVSFGHRGRGQHWTNIYSMDGTLIDKK